MYEKFLFQGIDIKEMLAGASLMDKANRTTVVRICYLFFPIIGAVNSKYSCFLIIILLVG